MGGGKGSAPPPPDYTPIAAANKEAAEIQAQVAREQLAWAKDTYKDNKELTDLVAARGIQSLDTNTINAEADRKRYERVYQPLEDKLVDEANNYASGARKDLDMGRAAAQVGQQFDAQRTGALQNLESFGVDPSSTRYAALDMGMRSQKAAAQAGAANQAGQQTEAIGRALRSEAINVGRGLPGQVAQTYGTALQAGNSAANTTLAQTASGAQTMGTAPQYYQQQGQFLNNWGNTLNMGYQNQLAQYNANNSGGSMWGSIGGAVAGAGAKALFSMMEDGGAVGDVTPGGNVPVEASPSGGGAIDDVPSRLTVGEFVLPKDVMQWKGEEWAQKQILKAREEKSKAGARPEMKAAPVQPATFVSRPGGALPTG